MKLPRFFAVAAAAGAMVLAQAVGISPAHAAVGDLACNYDYVNFNACLNFQGTGQLNYLTAHVGLDVFMSQVDAQADITTPPRALLWAHVPNHSDRFIGELSLLPGWPAAGTSGFGAEWSGTFYQGDLNANTSGEDQLYVVTLYYDQAHSHSWVSHNTGTVHGEFVPIVDNEPGGGGGGGCLRSC
jgi:hypothetical protein